MAKKNKRTSSVRVASTAKTVEFDPDYTHVKRDLTRIATLAGSFFVLLIVISFFLK